MIPCPPLTKHEITMSDTVLQKCSTVPGRLIELRIIESATYRNQMLLGPLYTQYKKASC